MTRTQAMSRRSIPAAAAVVLAITAGIMLPGCSRDDPLKSDPRWQSVNQQVAEKWGKGIDELPEVELVIISPHNQNIENEFEAAFAFHYALQAGKRVRIQWRDVGGGASRILEHLRNLYKRTDSAGMDVVFGGGEDNFEKMGEEGILQKMQIPESFTENVPSPFGGLHMYDPNSRWAGAAVSGFGFLYNREVLDEHGIAPPKQWDDLADDRFVDFVALADPSKSGSAAAAYEMIVQSAEDWPDGWAKLLSILGNAKKFYDGASGAADAVLNEAPVAACIDFYGVMRVHKYPETLVYVSPAGQTAYSPDPIGILKNPPHPELAQAFVDFVLSLEGQGLWGNRVGTKHGPVAEPLHRQPIRRDAYTAYGDRLLGGVESPYKAGNEMTLDIPMRKVRFGVLKYLVRAAAVDNAGPLKQAKAAIVAAEGQDRARLEQRLYELPPNVRTREQIADIAERLRDPVEAEKITTAWHRFFREKYETIAR